MATTKISALSALTTPDGAEELLINDSGTSKKITIDNVTENNFTDALKTKLDGVEASATADQSNAEIKTAYEANSDTNAFTDADHSKLDGIEASADVTDATNVTAAGALMDSEVTNLAQVKAFDSSDYATSAQGTLATNALPKSGGAMTGAITTNSTFDGRDVATDGTKLDGIAASANNYVHPNHSGEVTSTADGATVIADNVVDEANLKVSNTPTNGYFLSAQSGNTGGMTWAEVDALPSQTSNSGKYLTTNGSAASWAVLDTDANTTTKGLYEHAHTISSNYSITSGNNAMTAGPITINSGVSVTIPTGSTWVIA
jgi:hypothetical protein